MKTNQRGWTLVEGGGMFVLLLALALVGGWIANIVKLIGMFDGPVTAFFIGRAIGIFVAPLGGVLGYF